MQQEINLKSAQKFQWKRWALVLILGTIVILVLYVLLFNGILYFYSRHHRLRHDIGRGLFWYYYFWAFGIAVFLSNLLYLLFGKGKLSRRLIINGAGWIALFGYSAPSLNVIPYAASLPNVISLILLIILPFLIEYIWVKRNYTKNGKYIN